MGGRNVAQIDQALADASIEEIAAMALKDGDAETHDSAEETTEQDVQASSGQVEEQATEETAKTENSKELNFAKLRTKLEAQEREVQRLAEENKRLADQKYVSELPEDYVQKVAEVDARLTKIDTDFYKGEIDLDERTEQMRQANAERDALLATSIKAEIAKEMQSQRDKEVAEENERKWWKTVDSFIASKPDSVDYAADEARHSSLNTYVKALGADPDNANKDYLWVLQTAHALVKAKHGISTQPAATRQESKPVVNHTPSSPINTLSDLPGGLTPSTTESDLYENISGAALTNRFHSMTSAQIDAELAKIG